MRLRSAPVIWIVSFLAGLAPCLAIQDEKKPPLWEAEVERLDSEADTALAEGRLEEAARKLRQALHLRQENLEKPDLETAAMMHRLAAILAPGLERAEAETLYRSSNDILEQAGLAYQRELAIGLIKLGELLITQGRFQEAAPVYHRAEETMAEAPDIDSLDIAKFFNNLTYMEFQLAHYSEAEVASLIAIDIRRAYGWKDSGLATDLNNLAEIYRVQARWEEAEPLYLQALDIFRAKDDVLGISMALANLAILDGARAWYPSAEARYREAITLMESTPGSDPLRLATIQDNLGEMLTTLARFPEAEELLQRALAVRQDILGDSHAEVAASLEGLARLRTMQVQLESAEALFRRALVIREKTFPKNHPEVATGLNNLAILLMEVGRYAEAEALVRRAQGVHEKAFGSHHPWGATDLHNLAALAQFQGRPGEAIDLFERSLDLRRALHDEDGAVGALNILASLYADQGRLAEALRAVRQSLDTLERLVGRRHPRYATGLGNLAMIYEGQQRSPQAEALHREALEILEKVFGGDHPDVATTLSSLGRTALRQGRFLEAEAHFERVLAIREKILGPQHPAVATALKNLAWIAFVRGESSKAESLLRRSLELRRKVLAPDHPDLASSLDSLASLLLALGRGSESAEMVDEALRILERVPAYPEGRASLYGIRARLRKQQGDLAGAIAALGQALAVAEQLRPNVGGSEETKAVFLTRYETLFHDMVSWQLEAGRIDRAFENTERRRARVLLDQIAAAHIDWRAGIPDEIRSPLLEREARAGARLAEMQQRVRVLAGAVPAELAQALREAESTYAEIYEEIRNASLLWQKSVGGEPLSLDQVQTEIVRPDELALLYDIGDEESYLFVIPPAGEAPRVLRLEVPEDAARLLGLEPGPLRADDLDRILLGQPGDERGWGLLEDLSAFGRGGSRTGGHIRIFGGTRGSSPAAKLHALWQVLLPAEARTQWKDCREAIVVPDGSLHLLPFEALIIERAPQRTVYWLDEGPVVRYAPSLTALRTLEASVPSSPIDPAKPEMLSLSDPVFDVAEVARRSVAPNPAPKEAVEAGDGVAAARSASFFLTGPLDDLHGTAWEREAILEVLGKERVSVLQELGATEAALRQALPGRRYLHLATHGLIDEKRSNLFAALVLTPSLSETPLPQDDGLLQLHEIYDLDLSGCQVAVLSACRTNVGRSVRGEGVFALSRGLLVAGARRVVASQWSVNDASTAELIASFFRQVEAQETTGAPNYALALRNARREIRETGRWAGPRYWAPFVLIGAR